ncbi:hypothetical protein CASFOL_018958 [Castilleja foliolosa]|uniref:TPX2 C-terminal domain-containing protein n=1 Tax=Castilleja foliolosa TaxID=1961234 RepID=A0ABD3D4C1_9LAMI
MGDSTCLLHGFSYASAIPNESKQGNSVHALGESISFGRFMKESLSWEKWSSFSSSPHKKYVEEAERYAQPGSVAQKKAFFEAHYKRIAAQKAAAALLDQQNANDDNKCAQAEIEVGIGNTDDGDDHDRRVILDSQLDDVKSIEDVEEDGGVNGNNQFSVGVAEIIKEGESAITTEVEVSGESPMRRISDGSEMPLLKHNSVATDDVSSAESKRKSSLSCLKSSIRRKTWKIPSTPAAKPKPVTTNTQTPYLKNENNDVIIQSTTRKPYVGSTDNKRASSTKSLRELINLVPFKETDKEPSFAAKKGFSGSTKTPKVCSTPLRTPIVGTTKGESKNPAATPLTENKRMKTPIDPSAARGSKTNGPKWHILSAVSSKSVTAYRNKLQSPCLSTPFTLRTEERAAKRKQKLEEKFNANAVQITRQQNKLKEQAGNELRKLSCTFCFKARPLPKFYKEIDTSVDHQLKKTPLVARSRPPQTAVLGRNNSNKKQGNISMPPAPTIPKLSKKKVASKAFTPLLRIAPENTSPNIQQMRNKEFA